jgi:hypothetical protein
MNIGLCTCVLCRPLRARFSTVKGVAAITGMGLHQYALACGGRHTLAHALNDVLYQLPAL